MMRLGRASSSRSKKSRSIPVADREKMLKLAPPATSVAPRGCGMPFLARVAAAALLLILVSVLRHGASFQVPDILRVFRYGAVARELAGTGYVQDHLARPCIRIGVQLHQPAIRVEVRR